MKAKNILPGLLLLCAPCCLGQTSPAVGTATPIKCPVPVVTSTIPKDKVEAPNKTADLHSVIVSVQAALKCYQDNVGVGPDSLPQLQSAEFDFKTTTGKIGGVTVSFFIFGLKSSKESDVTNDITFTYGIKSNNPAGGHALLAKKPYQPLADALVADLQAAAAAVKESAKVNNLPFKQLKVVLTFGIVLDTDVTINAPVPLVVLGAGAEYKKNEAQTVTLTFAQPQT